VVLVDTSVWVDHLQRTNAELTVLLNINQVLTHPFVVGELALGSLQQRSVVIEALSNLPLATQANDSEVMQFITANALHGMGIGYVDAHLLAATKLTPTVKLLTLDKRLQAAAHKLGLDFLVSH
jgi:predicted nucleic acid-binding protein